MSRKSKSWWCKCTNEKGVRSDGVEVLVVVWPLSDKDKVKLKKKEESYECKVWKLAERSIDCGRFHVCVFLCKHAIGGSSSGSTYGALAFELGD